METQIVRASRPCTLKRTTLGDLKFSKTQIKFLTSLLNDSSQLCMLKNKLQAYLLGGNEYFKKSEWQKAVEQYSLCIQTGLPFALTGTVSGLEIKRDTLAIVASNRTQAFLNQRRWDKALLSAEEAVIFDPKHVKSLYRKAKALEALQHYKRACPVLEYALELNPGNKVIKAALDQCRLLYHQSVTGEYDLPQILCGRGPTPIFSDFVGPVEIKLTPTSGRGLFLTEAVEPGRLLMVGNALAFGGSDRNDRWEQFAGLTEEMLFLCHSSERFLHQLHYLRGLNDATKVQEVPPMELFIPGSHWSPDPSSKLEIPPSDEVWGQALTNSFDAQPAILPVKFGEDKSEVAASHPPVEELFGVIGVWALPSFMNHSCAPNCSTHNVGRAMFVRAAESMPAGQELKIAYLLSDEIDRESKFRNWNFKCKCERCLHDKQIRPFIEELLAEAEELKSEFNSTPTEESWSESCRLVARIEDAIKNLPIELGDRQRNWIRYTFIKIYHSKLNFIDLLTGKERLDLLRLILAVNESVNSSVGGSDLQIAVCVCNTVKAKHGKSSGEYQEARRDLERYLTKSLGNLKEAEIEEILETRLSESKFWL